VLGKLSSQALAYLVLLDKQLLSGTAATSSGNLEASWTALDEQANRRADMLYWNYGRGDLYCLWDDRTATAAALRAMLAHDPHDARVASVLRWLMLQRTNEYWDSTLDTSFIIAGLCDYMEAQGADIMPSGAVRVMLNGQLLHNYTLSAASTDEPEFVIHAPASLLKPGKNYLTFERTGGKSPVFYATELRQTIAGDELAAVAHDGISVQREYLHVLPRRSGQSSWSLQTTPAALDSGVNQLNQGDHIRVRLNLNAPRDMSYVMIEDEFPSGCEPTERGSDEMTDDWSFWYSQCDVRDDRIAFFARTLTKGKHVLEYNLRAQTPGTYRAMPALLQEMYQPEVRAESAEARVEVQ
jgi:hypothetical protein